MYRHRILLHWHYNRNLPLASSVTKSFYLVTFWNVRDPIFSLQRLYFRVSLVPTFWMRVQWATRIQNTTSITVEWLVSNTGVGYSGYYWVRFRTRWKERRWHCVDLAQHSAFVIMISRLLLSSWQNRKEGKLRKSFAGTFVTMRLVVLGAQKTIWLLNWHPD